MSSSHPSSSPTRRQFLGALGTGLAASVAGPTLLHATDKAGAKRPVVGSGEFTYEVHHDWGELPAGLKYGNTHGVAEDAQGRIYVHHTVHASSDRHDTMVVFDAKGRFVRSWGKEFEGGAHGLHIGREGKQEFLILCDTKRGTVTKVSPTGEQVWQLGYPKESAQYPVNADGTPGVKYSPTNIALAPNGDVYVGDGYGSSYINQYRRVGQVRAHVRRQGQGGGATGLPARAHRRYTRGHAGAAGGRPEQPPAAAVLARRHAPRV